MKQNTPIGNPSMIQLACPAILIQGYYIISCRHLGHIGHSVKECSPEGLTRELKKMGLDRDMEVVQVKR